MYKILVSVVLALMLVVGGAFADQTFNVGQDRYYSPNPSGSRTVTADYTLTAADKGKLINVDTTSGAITITLPDIVDTLLGNQGSYIIKNTGTTGYAVTVTASTADSVTNTIEGVASRALPASMSGSSTIMFVTLRAGYDWKVTWETSPVVIDMFNNRTDISRGRFLMNSIATAPTTSITLTPYTYCGKRIPVATDALTLTLFAAGSAVGCEMEFVNTGAAGAAIIDIKAPATDAFYGTLWNPGATAGGTVVSSTTGSTLSNTKTTAKTGDTVRIYSINTGSWIISNNTGTWTTK